MLFYDDTPPELDSVPDSYPEAEFLRDQLQEARDEIDACYELLRECQAELQVDEWASNRDCILRKIEARLLPAAKGSTLERMKGKRSNG